MDGISEDCCSEAETSKQWSSSVTVQNNTMKNIWNVLITWQPQDCITFETECYDLHLNIRYLGL
jgi:hypothetical protein